MAAEQTAITARMCYYLRIYQRWDYASGIPGKCDGVNDDPQLDIFEIDVN